MSGYFKAFDRLREQGWFIGEMIWNFADFKTSSGIEIYYFSVFENMNNIFFRCEKSWFKQKRCIY